MQSSTWSEWMVSPQGRWTLGAGTLVLALLILTAMFLFPNEPSEAAGGRELTLAQIPFNGQRAYEMLQRLCDLGPRYSGSPGMIKQQVILAEHFTSLGGKVTRQSFPARNPETGERVEMTNLIVEWHPERKERILFCAHYDTRPFPDSDPMRPRGVFVGANDGASGAALLAEFGRHMAGYQGPYGVDFVLFDGEELVYDNRRDPYFLGSEHFARDYRAKPPGHRYRWGILVDMIGDKELQIYQEAHSVEWPETRPLVAQVWQTAARLGVHEFIPRVRHRVNDDHVPLRNIGGIPTINIIDFDYPRPGIGVRSYWHTEADTPDKCSALSLAKVGWVLDEWLKTAK